MTSLAILPPLKRSITDVMDEELYHIPNSPIQFSSAINVNATHQYSSNSSPIIHHNSLFNHNNASNTSLTIPELILDNLSKQNTTNSASTSTSTINPSMIDANHYNEYTTDKKDSNINPFTAYGNPDSFIKSRQMSPPPPAPAPAPTQTSYTPIALPQGFPQRPMGRRSRIVDEDESHNPASTAANSASPNDYKSIKHKKKPTDEFLYNTDISPSHLISINQNDDYLFIINQNDDLMDIEPATSNNRADITNSIIPGFENDYLLYDEEIYHHQGDNNLDEDIEAELSDDEDDDENDYYHVDDAFDEYMMMSMYNDENGDYLKNHPIHQQILQQYQKQQQQPPQIQPVVEIADQAQIQPQVEAQAQTQDMEPLPNLVPDEEDEEDDEEEVEDEEMDDMDIDIDHNIQSSTSSKSHHTSISAAEITANNPNHQCDLINPSTGLPCHKQFSRPYDLIRHQETIHASKKKIFRCVICEGRLNGGLGNGKDKTFSRGDALSRHIKVKHGLVGKEALDIINEAKENVEYVSV